MKPLWQCFHIVLFVFQQPRPQGFSLKKWVGHPFFKGKALGTRLVFQQFTIFLFDLDFCFGNKRVKSTSLKSELLTENNGMQFTLTFPNSLQFVQKVPSVYICRLYVFTQLSARESPWVDTAHMIWMSVNQFPGRDCYHSWTHTKILFCSIARSWLGRSEMRQLSCCQVCFHSPFQGPNQDSSLLWEKLEGNCLVFRHL